MRRILTSAAAVVFAGIAFAGCGDDDDGDEGATDTTVADGGTTLTLVATDFQFDKTQLTATSGEPITLVLQNDADGTKHNLTIEDLDVDEDAEGGSSAEASVTPDAGTYDYFCEYHPSGMKGTLTVS